MVREGLKLLFLIVAYNFLLKHLSDYLQVSLFPKDMEDMLLSFAFTSALYLAWLTGERKRTVAWLAYLFFIQILGLALIRHSYEVILSLTPPFIITLGFISLFESPVEKRLRELQRERERLEQELSKNELETKSLREQLSLLSELVQNLSKEKENIELKLSLLRESETEKRKELEREREELLQKLNEANRKISEYTERLERLTSVNKELFALIDALSEKESHAGKDELSRLRQERKRLAKELSQLHELLEELSRENEELTNKYEKVMAELTKLKKEKEDLLLAIENYKRSLENKREIYKELLSAVFERIEFEDKAVDEFMEIPYEAKGEFLRELLLLNMKNHTDRFETMRGYKNIFKLKPKGGRIYFTYGNKRLWRVVGFLWGEDRAQKTRYAKENLIKYKA